MTIETAYRRTTYLLAAIGYLSLLITEQIPGYLFAVIIFTIPGSYWAHATQKVKLPSTAFWNVLSVGFFLYEGFMAIYSPRELIVNVAEFLIVLQSVRLWLLKGDRDYLQVYGLSLLHLIAGAVMTAELAFSLFFIAYIVTGTWALVVFNLQRELKGEKRRDITLQRVVSKKFFAVLSLVSLMVFLLSLLFFLFFPRLNYNYFSMFLSKPTPQSGFSNRVRLGEIGRIKLDHTPVMRVSLSGPLAKSFSPDRLYMRGLSLDYYDGKKWEATRNFDREFLTVNRLESIALQGGSPQEATLIQNIVLEPRGNDVLFVLPKAVGIQTPFGMLSHRSGEDIMGSFAGSQRVKYSVYSVEGGYREEPRHRRYRNLDWTDDYLQIPEELDLRISQYAQSLTQNLTELDEKAKKLETVLRTEFRYTLEMDSAGKEDPLAYFLFTRKEGHCEYFASSLAIMLRTLGIPSRLVNGYYHGQWNRPGQYYLIRESDAHTWVEAFLPNKGWVSFDPTPPDPEFLLPLTMGQKLRQFLDSAQLLWVNWIVDYSIYQQNQAVNSFSMRTKEIQNGTQRKFFSWQTKLRGLFSDSSQIKFLVTIGVIVLSSLGGLYFIYKEISFRSRRAKKFQVPFYEKMLRLMERKGFRRDMELTPLEFARDLEKKLPEPAARRAVRELTEMFCRIRYGGEKLPVEVEMRSRQLLQDLKN